MDKCTERLRAGIDVWFLKRASVDENKRKKKEPAEYRRRNDLEFFPGLPGDVVVFRTMETVDGATVWRGFKPGAPELVLDDRLFMPPYRAQFRGTFEPFAWPVPAALTEQTLRETFGILLKIALLLPELLPRPHHTGEPVQSLRFGFGCVESGHGLVRCAGSVGWALPSVRWNLCPAGLPAPVRVGIVPVGRGPTGCGPASPALL